jgi:hypothetical protein
MQKDAAFFEKSGGKNFYYFSAEALKPLGPNSKKSFALHAASLFLQKKQRLLVSFQRLFGRCYSRERYCFRFAGL